MSDVRNGTASLDKSGKKILVAVIAYNEERNIRRALTDLVENNFGFDIVVIDNGSLDRTVDVAKEMGINVVSHCVNTGGPGGVVMTYFLYAYRHDYDILCQFDGDGQHRASELPKIIAPVLHDQADYVIGSRFLEKKGYQSSVVRRIGIRLFGWLSSLLIHQKLTDITSGFRTYGRKVIDFYATFYKHEISNTSELLLISHAVGARIKEVPVVMDTRIYGRSAYNLLRSLAYVTKGFVSIIGCTLQKSQIKSYLKHKRKD